ncbi:unnamed protein product [Lota lota]
MVIDRNVQAEASDVNTCCPCGGSRSEVTVLFTETTSNVAVFSQPALFSRVLHRRLYNSILGETLIIRSNHGLTAALPPSGAGVMERPAGGFEEDDGATDRWLG